MNQIKIALYSVFCSIVIFAMIFFISHPISFSHLFDSGIKSMSANWEIDNSELVKNVSSYCKPFSGEHQVKCVVNQVGLKYNYTARNDTVTLKSDLIPTRGYVCRDIAVTYMAIFKLLGWGNDFVYTHTMNTNHVYNTIWNYNSAVYCQVDMDRWNCW